MAIPPIGVFDSGVGGLSVLRCIRQQLPGLPVIYLADQAHVPYGARPLAEVRSFAIAITQFLVDAGARLVVVACNAASAAALHTLRQTFPSVRFVGMEPAVKPAAETTRTGRVGVLATPATFQGDLYFSVIERFANGVTLYQETCPGLVGQVENGDLDGPHTRAILETALLPMLELNIDTVVLGCTHYPFVIPLIQSIAGPGVRVIDPAPAVARQVGRLLADDGGTNPAANLASSPTNAVSPGDLRFYTSGPAEALAALLPRLLGETGPVHEITWDGQNQIIRR